MRKYTRPGATSRHVCPELDCRGLKICGKCFALRGPWSRPHGRGGTQKCECAGPRARGSTRRQQATWPGFDFNKIVELCYCCGADVLRSGSRWSVWFCDDCKARVVALNQRAQCTVIPIGRHSMMAGYSMSGGTAREPESVSEFVLQLNSLRDRITLLKKWATTIVTENVRAYGFRKGKDVPVIEYVDAIAGLPVDKARAFERMWAYVQSPREGKA